MKMSDKIDEISKALTDFQSKAPQIPKDKTVNNGKYKYSYSDLATIWQKIREPLAECGLAVVQMPSTYNSKLHMTTLVSHISGQWVQDTMELEVTNQTPQGQGSAITYGRRYMLISSLGLTTEDDNDARDHEPLLSAQQKARIIEAVYAVIPELRGDSLAVVNFIQQVTGKHPGKITKSEFTETLNSIKAYTGQVLTGT